MNLQQLDWMQTQLDQLRSLCDELTPGVGDPDLQAPLTEFKLQLFKWSESLNVLTDLIRRGASDENRASAFTELRRCSDSLLLSGKTLDDSLSSRHRHPGVVLGIADD